MNSKTYSSEGIILSIREYKEADKLVTIFAKKHGKIVLIAKGVKKPSSRKRGHLDLFNNIRFTAIKAKTFDVLIEVQVLDSFSLVKTDLSKSSVAYFFTDVINKVTPSAEAADNIYFLLLDYFEKLKTVKNLKTFRFTFIKEVLSQLGFWPANRELINPDEILEQVTERKLNSIRVGKKVLS